MGNEGWQIEQISLAEYRALPVFLGQSLLQSAFWGELKAKFGWRAHYLQLTLPTAVSRVVGNGTDDTSAGDNGTDGTNADGNGADGTNTTGDTSGGTNNANGSSVADDAGDSLAGTGTAASAQIAGAGDKAAAATLRIPLLVMSRRLPLVGGTLLYIPHGPTLPAVVSDGSDDSVGDAARAADATDAARARAADATAAVRIGVAAHDSKAAAAHAVLLQTLTRLIAAARLSVKPRVIRWDPPFGGDLPQKDQIDDPLQSRQHGISDARQRPPRLHLAPNSIQPRYTIVVDLHPSEGEILGRMKAKTRYNIRLSERKGVTVREAETDGKAGTAELSRWYAVYRDTCNRNHIGQRSLGYFQALLSLGRRAVSDVRVELLLAHHQQTLLGGVIIAHYNGMATYLFGASTNTMRNLMANYLLQWLAMQRAKTAGCVGYDLFGVSPTERGHYLSGLYRFKSGFGGAFIQRWGSVDYIAAPLAGRLYRLCERAYFFYHRRMKHKR